MEFLARILRTRPDGREIYRYRVDDQGYRYAQIQLQNLLKRKPLSAISEEAAAIFCVFGAEWWRREHQSGPWSWEGIYRALGLSRSVYGQVVATVERGLEVLDRPLLTNEQGKQYLVTLACEGGLPLRRLEVEGASLRVFFRALLEHFEANGVTGEEPVEELARAAWLFARRMPVTLQHDVVFRLVGELVGRAWRLRRALGPDSRDPVRALDRAVPGWREELPLALSDTSAEALLRGLMWDVARVARGQSRRVRFVTRLTLTGSGHAVLTRTLTAPFTFDAVVLTELFGELPDGQRVYLRVRNEGGETLRLGALGAAGEDRWSWQPDPKAALQGASASGQLVLEALTRKGRPLESSTVEGSGRLGPLPWVFRQVEDSSWELVGTGSMTRREEELLIAVPPDLPVEGAAERVSEVLGRALYRVRGEVRLTMDADAIRIRTGEPVNSARGFELYGRVFSDLSVPGALVWLGLPRLRARQGPVVTEHSLEVRDGARWRPARGDEVGVLQVRALRDDEVVFRERVVVVPRDFSLRLEIGAGGRPGVVEVSSQRLGDAGVREDPAWTVRREGRGRLLVTPTGRPPARLPLHLVFEGAVLDGSVPFPWKGMRFEGPGGAEIAPGTRLHADRLGGIRAVGLAPPGQETFALTLRAMVPGSGAVAERTFVLRQEPSGEYALRLSDLETELLGLLGVTERLDGQVQVELWQPGAQEKVSVTVQRYDWRLRPERGPGEVVLEAEAPGASLQDVVVEARPFADIGRVEALPRLADARWRFEPERRSAGPWLITCREGSWYRSRPLAFTASGPRTGEPSGLQAISELPAQRRLEALHAQLLAMAEDLDHPDWPQVEAQARLLGHLPAATFDVLRALVRIPRAAAVLAVRCAGWAPTELVSMVDGLEELAFSWSLVPIEAWEQAFSALHGGLERLAPSYALREVQTRADSLGTWIFPALVAFHRWARRTRRAARLTVPNEVASCLSAGLSTELLALRAELCPSFRRHPAETRPHPPPGHPTVRPRWSVGRSEPDPDWRAALDAPVLAALVAAGHPPLDVPSTLFVKAVRAFDSDYFDQCFRITFSAVVASQGSL